MIKFNGAVCATGLFLFGLTACGGSSGGGGNNNALIEPEGNPETVMQAIGVKLGTTNGVLLSGSPPAATQTAGSPQLSAAATQVTASNDSTAKTDLQLDAASPLAVIYAKVVGAASFSQINVGQSKGTASSLLSLDIDIPERMADGEFCTDFSVEDTADRVSESLRICYQIQSTADDASSATALREALQGTWQGLCESINGGSLREFFVFSGSDVQYQEQQFVEVSDCTGTPDEVFNDTSSFSLGAEFTTDSGATARELDLVITASDEPSEVGERIFLIIAVINDQLILGFEDGVEHDVPERRPTALRFDVPFNRTDDLTGSGATSAR